jgi:hypothetical protein
MEHFNKHNRKGLITIIGFIGVLILLVFGISLFSHSANDTYKPVTDKGKGFIGKADALFEKLLHENMVENINATGLSGLNRKYPAFVFDVPDSLNSDLNIYDIRVVGINESCIKEEEYRNFYEGSSLPTLIKEQRLNKDKKSFHIDIQKKKGILTIKKIEMIRPLHSIKFSPKIWEGDIWAQSHNPVNNEDSSRFLIYGSSVVPVRIQQNAGYNVDYPIYLTDNNSKCKNGIYYYFDSIFNEIDWYEHYNKYYKLKDRLKIQFETNNEINNQNLYLQLFKDSIIFEASGVLYITAISKDAPSKSFYFDATAGKKHIFKFSAESENIRIFVEDKDRKKLSEFQLSRHNPLNKLAYVIETSKGKTRKQTDPQYTDIFTQQVVTHFLQNVNENNVPDNVNLSIDPFLSSALEKELEYYGKSFVVKGLEKDEHFEISMSIINTATGEILAAPYYVYTEKELTQERKISKRNPNMVRRYVGSCFKPIMTLASLQLYPKLIGLKTDTNMIKQPKKTGKKDKKGNLLFDTYILGCPIQSTFAMTGNGNHYTNKMDIVSYLAASNDVFPVVLAMYSFTKFNDENPLKLKFSDLKTYIKSNNKDDGTYSVSLLNPKEKNTVNFLNDGNCNFDINNSQFAGVFNNLYTIYSEGIVNNADSAIVPSRYLYRFLNDSLYFPEISPDITNFDYYSWNDSVRSFRGTVVPWVLGQGTNEWSPLKLAEAWSRMVTKYPLRISYIHNDKPAEIYENKPLLSQQTADFLGKNSDERFKVWNRFLDILKNAQTKSPNLLTPVYDQIKNIRINGDSLVILSKTGTPSDYERADWEHFNIKGNITYDVGLYSFSLMTKKQYEQLKKNKTTPVDSIRNAGITCVIRIVHSYREKEKPKITNVNSYDARNFLIFKEKQEKDSKSDNTRIRKLLFYTDRLFR